MKGSSMIIKKKTANHKEWLALRSGYIGGSDAAAVIGLNPYKSPFALWAEKTGQTLPFRGNIATRVGNELEQLVATLYAEETRNKVRNDNGTYFNDAYPWACANIDREWVVVEYDSHPDRQLIKIDGLDFGEIAERVARCIPV